MKTKIIRIGNSRGIRIPKPLLEEAGLEEEVTLRVVDGALVIAAEREPRDGWEAAAVLAHERRDDDLLDDVVPTTFDSREWEW